MPVTALVVPISGAYAGTWNALALGVMGDDGYVLRGTYQAQEVNATDLMGMTLVEAIYRGLNWRIRFRSMEFNMPGILAAMQAFGSTGNPALTFTPTLANIGNRMSLFSQALVLTALLTNPPTMPQTLTALGAVVAPQSSVEFIMTSKYRETPFEMILIPHLQVVGSLTVALSFTTT